MLESIREWQIVFPGMLAALVALGIYLSAHRVFGQLQLAVTDATSVSTERVVPLDRIDRSAQLHFFNQYHSLGLTQSNVSFWFSLGSALVGFGVIISGIFTAPDGSLADQGKSIVTSLSGTIVAAVSVLFHKQSKQARDLMSDHFEKLRNDSRLEDALALAREVADPQLQSRLKAVLVLNLADVEGRQGVISQLLCEQEGSVGSVVKVDKP